MEEKCLRTNQECLACRKGFYTRQKYNHNSVKMVCGACGHIEYRYFTLTADFNTSLPELKEDVNGA